MMKIMQRRPLLIALLYVLSACVQSSGRFGVDVAPPAASVSRSKVGVGETVTVTLKSSLGLDEGSERADETFFDTRLGACFVEGTPEVSRGGFCAGENLPLQPWAAGPADGGYVRSFGDVRVERGATYPLEFTFSFTVTEAVEVTINPWISVGSSGARGGAPARVIFK